jgi:hypothetical protein
VTIPSYPKSETIAGVIGGIVIFYILDYLRIAPDDASHYRFVRVLPNHGNFPLCPSCGARVGAKTWCPPFSVRLIGQQAGDLCCGACPQFLVSRRFMEAWERSGLKGMEIAEDPVEICPSEGLPEITTDYNVAFPAHSITRLDEAASGLEIYKLVGCDECRVAQRKKVDRLRIDERTWAGEDIFYPSGLYGHLVVTDRFRLFVEDHSFTNFEFIDQDAFNEARAR